MRAINVCSKILAGSVLLCLVAIRLDAGPRATVVSGSSRTNAAAAGGSFAPVFSGDGRSIVFVSHAKNLVTNDDLAPCLDVFVYDLASRQTQLVSVNTSGVGGGNADAGSCSISSNGQRVVFASAANNLVAGDTNAAADIFIRDLATGITRVICVYAAGA